MRDEQKDDHKNLLAEVIDASALALLARTMADSVFPSDAPSVVLPTTGPANSAKNLAEASSPPVSELHRYFNNIVDDNACCINGSVGDGAVSLTHSYESHKFKRKSRTINGNVSFDVASKFFDFR